MGIRLHQKSYVSSPAEGLRLRVARTRLGEGLRNGLSPPRGSFVPRVERSNQS